MTLAFNLPKTRPSLLAALDPRWKLAGFLALILATAITRSLLALGLVWLVVAVLALLGRTSVTWLLGRLLPVALVLTLLAGPLPLLLTREPPFWEWGWFRVSEPGLVLAATVILRGLGICALVLVLIASTPLHVLFQAAHSLRVPGLLIQLALLTLRYVALLASEFRRLRRAAQVRGFVPGANWHTYRTLGNLMGTLLVRGHERAHRVYQAMRARGFDGQFRSLHCFTTRLWDVLAWLVLTLTAVGIVMVGFL
jgi:cobalt/nickel transport system permease protein